jgi:hypothetical protein
MSEERQLFYHRNDVDRFIRETALYSFLLGVGFTAVLGYFITFLNK